MLYASAIDDTSRWTTKRNEVGTRRTRSKYRGMNAAKMREELNKFDDFKKNSNDT